jgi:alkanesulfonate monooxygenase SsuD/methylene tetrahydromethanopterin reductase-like flavin-dependent oxidoreductase (luciferase family)
MELGLYSFGDSSVDPTTGKYLPENVIFKNLLERIQLADQVGLNYFGLGEHHREDYPVSAPGMLLSAAAPQTSQIHLGSAVTVLPTKDPVRVFQQFSTLDQISDGRAELTVGTGAYVESYPLFGHELADAQQNFTEKLGLLRQLNSENPVTFNGNFRAPLSESGVWPRPFNKKLSIWVATGETPESSERAASFGFNANYSFLSAPPSSKKSIVDHFRATALAHGHSDLKVAVAGRGFVAENARVAKETIHNGWLRSVAVSQRERGREAPTREMFDRQANGDGPIVAGDPNEVADRLAAIHSELRHDRHILQFDIGNIEHALVMKSIELFGTKVLPQLSGL